MPPADTRIVTPDAEPPRKRGRWLVWAMLAAIVILVGTTAIAMSGWSSAIDRADREAARATALQAPVAAAEGLRQEIGATRKSLEEVREHGQALQAQLTASQASLAATQDKVTALEKNLADAEQTRAELQSRLDAPRPSAQLPEQGTGPQFAGDSSAATTRSDIAPELPLPGLPPGATPRDYLVAAQQAVREGQRGRAQSALERAETRLLNQASAAGNYTHPASHPRIKEIEQALDQLGEGNTDAVLRTIDGLLTRY